MFLGLKFENFGDSKVSPHMSFCVIHNNSCLMNTHTFAQVLPLGPDPTDKLPIWGCMSKVNLHSIGYSGKRVEMPHGRVPFREVIREVRCKQFHITKIKGNCVDMKISVRNISLYIKG